MTMWQRNEARPTKYRDILFRSALEARVAEELDGLGVTWRYELPAHEGCPSVPAVPYLPDFTIVDAPADLELPLWVEVKPADLLYAVRDHAGCPELFDGTRVAELNWRQLFDAQLDEVWKPKRLAELAGRPVLVVYQINRTRSLSVLMRPDRIELSRAHPTVNRRGVLRTREREEEQRRWREQYEREKAEREKQDRLWRQQVIAYAQANGRPARFGGRCAICKQEEAAASLVIFRAADDQWAAVCRSHLAVDNPTHR